MINTLFILGTKDPEMEEIKKILKKLNYNYTHNKKEIPKYKKYVKIETRHSDIKEYILIDHHTKEDYGYHLDYNHFLEASSIGQFLKYILINDTKNVIKILKLNNEKTNENKKKYYFEKNNWYISINNLKIEIPKKIVYIAGIDHCLKEAYLGKCKGIKNNKLIDKRLVHIAENLNENIEFVKKRFTYFMNKYFINENSEEIIDLMHIKIEGSNYTLDYLILREISLYLNKPIVVKIKNNNKNKLMFLSLNEEKVEEIINKKKYKNIKFKEVFGVPKRSYAGAII